MAHAAATPDAACKDKEASTRLHKSPLFDLQKKFSSSEVGDISLRKTEDDSPLSFIPVSPIPVNLGFNTNLHRRLCKSLKCSMESISET